MSITSATRKNICLAGGCALLAFGAAAADFVVSPKGSAAAAGSARAPFATVGRAQQAVRDLKAAQPDRAAPIVVEIRGGTYYLPAPLAFTAADSGTTSSPFAAW